MSVKNGQDARSTKNEFSCGTGKMPVPKRSTKNEFSCGTGKMPVPKQVIENGAISQFNLTYADLYRLSVMPALQTI